MKAVRNIFISFSALCLAFVCSLFIQLFLKTDTLIPAVFALAVLLISLFTEGYWYGFISALISVIAVNYASPFLSLSLISLLPRTLFLQ